jgi:hypothetical protein
MGGAWLGSPIIGHWFEKIKMANIILTRRLAGEAVGLSACLVFWGTKVNLLTMGVKVYHGMAVTIPTLHLLWIFWVICGALLTRRRRALRWLHIISLVYSVLIEALPWPPCPLTLLEAWLEARGRHPVSRLISGALLGGHRLPRYPRILVNRRGGGRLCIQFGSVCLPLLPPP